MKIRNSIHREHGGSLIEFVIILPVFILLILVLVDLSIILFDKAIIASASGKAARNAALYRAEYADDAYVDRTLPDGYATENDVVTAVAKDYANGLLITFSSSAPDVDVNDDDIVRTDSNGNGTFDSEDIVYVTVSFDYTYLGLPKLFSSFTGPLTLSSTTVMPAE